MRKGMTPLMYLVITVIILLIAGLVVITIFGKQLGLAADPWSIAGPQCDLKCKTLCLSTGTTSGDLPDKVWNAQKISQTDGPDLECSSRGPCRCGAAKP